MKKSKWVSYLLKILWVIGLIVLAMISYNYEIQISQTASETYNFIPVFGSKPVISILFGLYTSLIFVKRWSLRIKSIFIMVYSYALYPSFICLSNIGFAFIGRLFVRNDNNVPCCFHSTKNSCFECVWTYSRFELDFKSF